MILPLTREFPSIVTFIEPTQRTRSFLYAALGTVVAQSVKAGGVSARVVNHHISHPFTVSDDIAFVFG
jgi:hypothetical protein